MFIHNVIQKNYPGKGSHDGNVTAPTNTAAKYRQCYCRQLYFITFWEYIHENYNKKVRAIINVQFFSICFTVIVVNIIPFPIY